MTSPDELGPAWDRVLAADRPTVVGVHCDPEVPPIPPHATFDQARSAARAVLKGDPEAFHLSSCRGPRRSFKRPSRGASGEESVHQRWQRDLHPPAPEPSISSGPAQVCESDPTVWRAVERRRSSSPERRLRCAEPNNGGRHSRVVKADRESHHLVRTIGGVPLDVVRGSFTASVSRGVVRMSISPTEITTARPIREISSRIA